MTKSIKEASSIAATFDSLVNDGLNKKAGVVLSDFIRKDTERQEEQATIRNLIKGIGIEIDELSTKLDKAEKVTNRAALERKIAFKEADIMKHEALITEIETLRDAAASKRDAFIKAFDVSPFDALADSDLVRSGLELSNVS